MTRRFASARAHFDAARQLGGGGPLRGHGFLAEACVAGTANGLDMAIKDAVAPLDGVLLNDVLAVPTDGELAQWVKQCLHGYAPERVNVARQVRGGAEVDGSGNVFVWRRFRFEAAHRLPHVPAGHKCARLHGHGFEVTLHVRSDGEEPQCTADAQLASAWAGLAPRLDGGCLNDLPGLDNPTSERLAQWLWQALSDQLELAGLSVFETCTSGCRYDGERTYIWKSSRFEAALDGARGTFGHSYRVCLHAGGALDPVLGWVLDYGDLKALFEPLYRQLDHHRLDEVVGSPATPAAIAAWIFTHLQPALAQLVGVDVWPTPECGALLRNGEVSPGLV